jgi:molecular chaperone IbpA
MTDLQKIYKFSTANLPSRSIGFDRWLDFFELDSIDHKPSTFPPHNIIKTSEYNYTLELAVAGFTENDIDITLEKNQLTIIGEAGDKSDVEYIYRGIASRAFTKKFTLMDTIFVEGASLKDGVLRVYLKNSIPETDKPKKITIDNDFQRLENKQMLIE